jgi:Fic family protein
VSELASAVAALAAVPRVEAAVGEAREACTRLRWHQALRRRIPEAAAESRVRGAAASAELDGARLSVDIVRNLMRGASTWHTERDPVEDVARGAIAATAETEHLAGVVLGAPLQALARLHVVAAEGLVPDGELGRPRVGAEGCRELTDLGPALPASELPARLELLADLVIRSASLPAAVVAGLVHAEIATVRPFTRGNGVVARAMERLLVRACGLDPTGVAVPEWGYGSLGGPAYTGALAAYGTGSVDGVSLWLEHAAKAVTAGAAEGSRIADAVLAGRLGPS